MNFTASQIAAATGAGHVSGEACGPVLTDTRTLVPGSWFCALVGDRFDGHDFANRASDAGAAGAIFSRPVHGWHGAEVLVPDTTRALQDLGRAARQRLRGPVIGLTGSAGKTTTRALLALAVRQLGEVHQTTGNLNNHLGVPMTLLAAPESAAACVVEMGTSSHGEIAVLADIATPDVRLLLNVGASHLEELGGLDGVAREKGAIFNGATADDLCVVNRDDTRVMGIPMPASTRVISFGRHPEATVRLLHAEVHSEDLSTSALLEVDHRQVAVRIHSPGMHLAHNAAAALAVAWGLGLDPAASAEAMADYQPVGMRLRRESLPGGVSVINDAYNANPESMRASLSMLSGLSGRRFAVLGDMLELGSDEIELHRDVLGHAVGQGLDLVLVVGERMAAAAAAHESVRCCTSHEEAAEFLAAQLSSGDTLLVKGSRGARMERVLHLLAEGA